jgi:V8-like Glu-specific endopeptidase
VTRWLALFATLVVFAALTTQAAAKAPGQKTGQSPEEVARYWTDERMRDAKPRERARSGGGGGGKTGASVDAGSIPQHGKVFFTDGGYNYVCSGTALNSSNQSVVWTAGHCVTSDAPGDGMVTNFLFVPAYRDGARPYGNWGATRLYTTPGWQSSEEFGVDLGAAVVSQAGGSQTLNQAIGGGLTPIFYLQPALQAYRVYGYPAAGKFNGQRLRLCDTAGSRTDTSTTPDTVGVACDMTGGSSGGGWITSAGTVASVTSYGYSNLKNVLFGPHQEADAETLYSTAQNAAP